MMTAREVLEALIRIQPDFSAYWQSENYFVGDVGAFTPCGVFSHFTTFFCERHRKMKKEELEAIESLVGRCEHDEVLADAAYTCFLENIAGDPPDETLAPFLSPAAAEFMSHWRPQR